VLRPEQERFVEERTERNLPLLLVLALTLIVVGGTVDLVLDQPQQWLSFHVIFETAMIAGALTLATALWLGWWRAERASAALRRSLAERRAERDAWKASAEHALAGFGRAIDDQFTAWQLTPTEREVALLLLKGRSHKAIARATGRSDATVRQHATAIYQKAGLAGRAELAAYFLEDVALPVSRSA
jgi:DNA-binding CsgD family transcriptional regulator